MQQNTTLASPSSSSPRRVALILAAGSGQRFGGSRNKVYARLADGRTLLRAAVDLCMASALSELRVVIARGDEKAYAHVMERVEKGEKVGAPIFGAGVRAESVLRGLETLAGEGEPEEVLLHDAARPFASPYLIARLFAALEAEEELAGVFPARPVHDAVHSLSAEGLLTRSLPRNLLAHAQTPQVFRFTPLLAAHRAHALATRESPKSTTEPTTDLAANDDAGLLAAAGGHVRAIRGEIGNIKITTPEDLQLAPAPLSLADNLRVGTGFDMHRFNTVRFNTVPGAGEGTIRLGGVDIPSPRSLLGHSDGDVILHALTDAILGALAEEDIGEHFPSHNPNLRGADSRQFLRYARARMAARNARLLNVDVTLIGGEPKLAPHRAAIRNALAEILDLSVDRVSCKATTTDGLGALGRGEGVAAQAQILLVIHGQGEGDGEGDEKRQSR